MAARTGAVVTKSTARELVITRIFDAPRALVFEAWSKPEHMVHWFGPNGFTLPVCEMDFRVGGSYRLCMRASGGWSTTCTVSIGKSSRQSESSGPAPLKMCPAAKS